MIPKPGEVWLADLGLAAKTRPVIIVSRLDPDPPRALVLYVPLTTQNRNSRYEVILPRLPFLDRDPVANVQGLSSVPAVRLERRLGVLPPQDFQALKAALVFALDIERVAMRGQPAAHAVMCWMARKTVELQSPAWQPRGPHRCGPTDCYRHQPCCSLPPLAKNPNGRDFAAGENFRRWRQGVFGSVRREDPEGSKIRICDWPPSTPICDSL